MGNVEGLLEHNTSEFLIEFSPMFASLWENEKFQIRFKKKIYYIAENCYDTDEMDKFIDKYNDKISEFYTIMNREKSFFKERKSVVVSWFCKSILREALLLLIYA